MTVQAFESTRPRHHVAPDGMSARVMLSLLATAGFFYVNIMPAIVQGLIDGLGISRSDAGMVGSANVYGAALGALLAVLLVRRLPWRSASCVLLLGLIGIDLLTMLLDKAPALIALRFAHGVTGGMLVGIAYAVIARTEEPDRTFGVLLFVQFGLGGLGVLLLPGLVPVYGTVVLFATLIAFSAAALAVLWFLPEYPARRVPGPGEAPPTPIAVRPLALTLLAIFLFQAANMALFPYIISLGETAGLARGFILPTLAASSWVGLIGSGLVVWLSTRYGRLLPLVFAIGLTALGNGALHWSASQTVFLLANCGVGITWAFVMPYLLGMCASFDASGRIAALGGLCSKLGLASGPLVAALMLGDGGFGRVINLAVLMLLACIAAVILPASHLDRAARSH